MPAISVSATPGGQCRGVLVHRSAEQQAALADMPLVFGGGVP
jgi:hypothetical protein